MSVKDYFLSTRPQFLPAIVIPVALGGATAWHGTGRFDLLLFLLSVMAALFYHAGMNVLNDYFDFKNGTDNINTGALTPYTGGSRFIQNGVISPQATLGFGLVLLSIGSLIGLYLAVKVSPFLIFIGAFGLLTGFFYSAPPLFLASRGLGELTVAVNFGLLAVSGSYLVQTGDISIVPVISSLPVSFLIAALLLVNEFPDYEADKNTGKNTLVVRLGPERARYCLLGLVAGAYLSLILGTALGIIPPASFIALLSLIPAVHSASVLMRNYKGGSGMIPSIKSIILAHLSAGVLLTVSVFL